MSRWSDDEIAKHVIVSVPPEGEPLELEVVRDQHLRLSSGSAENDYVERLIRVACMFGERWTRRAWMPQTLVLHLDSFPVNDTTIYLPMPPLIEVVSFVYVDGSGDEQELTETTDFKVSGARSRENTWARIRPAYGTSWPSARAEMDAISITFRAGFEDASSPAQPDVPDDLAQGALILLGEMYKHRSESVHAFNQNPALVRARDLWLPYRIF